jgi:signal transduction histidine kinase
LVPVCLSDVVSDVLSQLDSEISERGARIDVKGPFPHVVAHEATLCQIVLNLLTNAMKFVAEGTRPQITVRAERCKQSVRLSVADNGIGIDPAHQQRIFHIFERLHGIEQYSGTGIGLAIVRKGVERLGGRVGVDSTPAVGSEFWIELAAATNDDV